MNLQSLSLPVLSLIQKTSGGGVRYVHECGFTRKLADVHMIKKQTYIADDAHIECKPVLEDGID